MQPSESGTRNDLVFYRIETAKEDLKSAKILREANSFKGANIDEVNEQIATAEEFIEMVEQYCRGRLGMN